MILSITMLICSAAVLGIYIWHGQWMAIGVALLAGGCGRLMFGLVELLLFPLTKLMLYFAQRGKRITSCLVSVPFALVMKIVFFLFCATVLIYFFHVPGPPRWLAVVLAFSVIGFPFDQVTGIMQDDSHPCHVDLLAVMFGVPMSGALLLAGKNIHGALAPLALFFLLSAIYSVFWWATKGAAVVEFKYILSGRTKKERAG